MRISDWSSDVCSSDLRYAGTEKFDEAYRQANLPQPVGDVEREIGRGHSFAQPPEQPYSNDLGDAQPHRRAEHHAFGLEPADPPAAHAAAAHHRCMAVGPGQRVWQRPAFVVAVCGWYDAWERT